MQTSVAGSRRSKHSRGAGAGFTLLELLVVVAIIGIASAGVVFALRDPAQSQLEREGQRLAALLESARALSRVSGVPVRWVPVANGFVFEGLPPKSLPQDWLAPGIVARTSSATTVVLGPEPIIAPQDVTLSLADHPGAAVHVVTNGLAPFTLMQSSP